MTQTEKQKRVIDLVRYRGQVWQRYHTVLDLSGCYSLTSLQDSSTGTAAKPQDCHPVSEEDYQSTLRWLGIEGD